MNREDLDKKIEEMFEQGLSDNDILNVLVTEQGEELTYMELRIKRAEYEVEHPETVQEDDGSESVEETAAVESSSVITIDLIKKPGALLSGKADLPSGAEVVWTLDQSGRINMNPAGDKEPTQGDLRVFQEELRKELQKTGGIL